MTYWWIQWDKRILFFWFGWKDFILFSFLDGNNPTHKLQLSIILYGMAKEKENSERRLFSQRAQPYGPYPSYQTEWAPQAAWRVSEPFHAWFLVRLAVASAWWLCGWETPYSWAFVCHCLISGLARCGSQDVSGWVGRENYLRGRGNHLWSWVHMNMWFIIMNPSPHLHLLPPHASWSSVRLPCIDICISPFLSMPATTLVQEASTSRLLVLQ